MKEISIKIKRIDADYLETLLAIFGDIPYEVQDDLIIDSLNEDEKNWDYFDIDRENISEDVCFKLYQDDLSLKEFLDESDLDYSMEYNTIDEMDYENDWKTYFKPIKISNRLWINPVWENDDNAPIVINPGMAFGTGSHETTYLVLSEIDRLEPSGLIMDVGTGSGILAIAASKLFGAKVDAYEIDPLAVKSANENISLNKLEDRIDIIEGDFRNYDIKQYDNIFSNIYAETLIEMMPDFAKRLKSGGHIILSGIVASKVQMVKDSLFENGFLIDFFDTLNDWAVVSAIKK